LSFGNGITARVHGAEISGDWRPVATWRITGSYSYLRMNLVQTAGSQDTTTEGSTEGSSPRHMADLRSSLDLPGHLGLDVTLRYAGSLAAQKVEAYTEMDLLVGRPLARGYEISLAGQNLLAPHHAEFGGGRGAPIEIERSVYGRIVRRW